MDFDPAAIAAVVLLAFLFVLATIKRKRAAFRPHIAALQARPKRALVIGKWTREEVAKHASATDLWLIIQDKATQEWRVYDMTDYVEEHPGGYAILNNAGGDATKGFHGPQHPPTVFDLLGDYYIGTLVDP